MAERLISDMTLKVLGFEKGHALSEFRHMILQDGSSFAIHDGLREVFPGRFKVVKPAAVELHTTMDLLCDAPTTVVLTPDTANEQAFLPEPAALRDSVLLADRGYVDLHYLRRVQDEHGFFLIRAKAGMNPQVVEAFREDGKRLQSLRNKRLQVIHAKLPVDIRLTHSKKPVAEHRVIIAAGVIEHVAPSAYDAGADAIGPANAAQPPVGGIAI